MYGGMLLKYVLLILSLEALKGYRFSAEKPNREIHDCGTHEQKLRHFFGGRTFLAGKSRLTEKKLKLK